MGEWCVCGFRLICGCGCVLGVLRDKYVIRCILMFIRFGWMLICLMCSWWICVLILWFLLVLLVNVLCVIVVVRKLLMSVRWCREMKFCVGVVWGIVILFCCEG